MFSCKRWNSTKFDRLELTSKTFGSIQTWENNTKVHVPKQKKCDSLVLRRSGFWMIWRYHGIPCAHFYSFIFFFRTMVRKDTWMSTTSVNVMVNFSKVTFWKSLDRSYVWSYFSIIYEAHWQQRFKRRSAVENFMDMDQHMC